MILAVCRKGVINEPNNSPYLSGSVSEHRTRKPQKNAAIPFEVFNGVQATFKLIFFCL